MTGGLELEPHRQLRLTGIADSLAQEPVEVKQGRRRKRVDEIFVVKKVEDFNFRNDSETIAERNGSLRAKVKGEEPVVLAQEVSPAVHQSVCGRVQQNAVQGIVCPADRASPCAAWIRAGRLRRVRLHAHVD